MKAEIFYQEVDAAFNEAAKGMEAMMAEQAAAVQCFKRAECSLSFFLIYLCKFGLSRDTDE